MVIQLKEKVQVIESQVLLVETILRGDGVSESLLTKFALLEKDVQSVLDKIEQFEKEKNTSLIHKTRAMTERMKIFIGAMVTLVASIISAVTAYYFK